MIAHSYNKYNHQPTKEKTMRYDDRLWDAIDELRDMLSDIVGDYDIHNMIDDLSIRYDVEKRDLLDWYDNN